MSREMLLLVDALARERTSPRKSCSVPWNWLASATKKRIHDEAEVRVSIDRNTGNYDSFRRWLVVVADNEYVNEYLQVPLSDAQKDDPGRGGRLSRSQPLEPIDFGRIGAQAAKQVILQRFRDAEREQILSDFPEPRRASSPAPSSAWSAAMPSSRPARSRLCCRVIR